MLFVKFLMVLNPTGRFFGSPRGCGGSRLCVNSLVQVLLSSVLQLKHNAQCTKTLITQATPQGLPAAKRNKKKKDKENKQTNKETNQRTSKPTKQHGANLFITKANNQETTKQPGKHTTYTNASKIYQALKRKAFRKGNWPWVLHPG